MTNKELNNKLRALQALRAVGEPSALWTTQTRALLMERMQEPVSAHPELPLKLPRRGFFPKLMFAMRPVMAVFVVLGFGAFGWLFSVSAALGTLPGDALYGLKTATERAQLTFTTDVSAKTMLHLEFVGRRLNEVATIAESDDPNRDNDATHAVNELQREIVRVSDRLEEVRLKGSVHNASEVAQAVDRKVAEVRAVFGKTRNRLAGIKKQVHEVEALADDVSIQAVAVLVETSKQGVGPNNADLTDRLKEKIAAAEQKILVSSLEGTEQAKAALEQAKVALAESNLTEAVNRVQETTTFANQEEEVEVQVEINKNQNVNAPANANTNVQIKAVE